MYRFLRIVREVRTLNPKIRYTISRRKPSDGGR